MTEEKPQTSNVKPQTEDLSAVAAYSAEAAAKAGSAKEDDLITIAGGVEIEVAHLDGSKETVKVRQIPATKLQEFVQRLADEATAISIYCDKPRTWADTLDLTSVHAVVEKGLEINGPFLNAWFRRQAKWRDMTNVGAIAELQSKVATLVDALRSGNLPLPSPGSTSSAPSK